MLTLLTILACGGPAETPAPETTTSEEASAEVAASAETPPLEELPNIIVITLDTTRADAIGTFGGPEGITPTVDSWADRGVAFEWAFSHSPTTLSSHSSLFSGLDPHQHGVPRNGFPLSDEVETLAEVLQETGYDTLGVIGASVINEEMGMAQGFRLFDDSVRIDMGRRFEDRGDRVTRRTRTLLQQRDRERPLHLWVHYYDAHSPYEAPATHQVKFVDPRHRINPDRADGHKRLADWIRAGDFPPEQMEYLVGLYHSEVSWVDYQLDRLFTHLDEEGILEDAIVVITSDHGEMFGEVYEHPLGHGFEVDTWATRVPLVIARTQNGPTPARVTQPVKLSDVAPTVLSMAGINRSLGTGQNLTGLMRGEPLQADPIFFEASKPEQVEIEGVWNNTPKERGVLIDGHIYIASPLTPEDPFQLFLLDEQQSRVERARVLPQLREALDGWDEAAPAWRSESFSSETEEALRALGYIE